MNKPRVSIGLILYKGEKHLPFSLESLLLQDYKDIEFLIRDQSPKHEAYNYVKKNLPEVFKKIKIQKGKNLMHSGGHNKLINKMTGDYYFCVSQDMYYPKNFVSKVVLEMEKRKNLKYASATVKIMKWEFENITDASTLFEVDSRLRGNDKYHFNTIDSCGIGKTFYYQFYDIGQGEEDQGQYDKNREVFGASGALAVYRKSALERVAYHQSKKGKEYFDERLHYKNDVDVSMRLRNIGEKCLFIPMAKVYHDRKLSSEKSRKQKSSFERKNSYFGNLVILKKLKTSQISLVDNVTINIYSMLMYLYIFFFERELLAEYKKVKNLKIYEN